MNDYERDRTQDWRLPDHSRPPLLGELVERIDEALAVARASEAAVMTVGAAALDAAEQARRAADLAARASATMDGGGAVRKRPATDYSDSMDEFRARADRVAERLHRLQSLPLAASV